MEYWILFLFDQAKKQAAIVECRPALVKEECPGLYYGIDNQGPMLNYRPELPEEIAVRGMGEEAWKN
jgi:hypothetical protein